MDRRVLQGTQLLQEAGCLDLLAAGVGRLARPARQAADGLAAAVAAFSPPRGKRGRPSRQVSRMVLGRVLWRIRPATSWARCEGTAPPARAAGGSGRRGTAGGGPGPDRPGTMRVAAAPLRGAAACATCLARERGQDTGRPACTEKRGFCVPPKEDGGGMGLGKL
ncbi:hypothetical protein NDU88_005405 [Pleurodeles waltl]|uniref:Uncharacterized protein n=1 Tax=Pleurodeles waltl TaxID=8319 RepID=A0AAV7TUQ2_PLEWA|nr:hypothetical protein NDU88_005405 [Pleurodeles waltl]